MGAPGGRHVAMAVAVVMVVLVADTGGSRLTISSRLIHRFSEEARARLKVATWPERRSMEYYKLLGSRDVQRQKMRLGPRYRFVYPSEGSSSLSFGNDWGWLHYTWIDLGTPNVSFLVALDAGSDLLWVPCDCVQCAPLSSSYHSSLVRDLNQYNPSGSSTSKLLACSNQLCELGPKCKSPQQPCPYSVEYFSEDTSSSGFLVEDTMHFVAGSDGISNISTKAPVIIGCGRKQSGGYLDGVAPDGLMGLGLGKVSVPSMLAKTGLVRNSFSLCFDDEGSGRIFFGDQGAEAQQSTPFLPINGDFVTYIVGVKECCIGSACLDKTSFKALVDSGSSFTYLPKDAYNSVVDEFDSHIDATRTSYEGSPWKYCYESSSTGMPKTPSVVLKFGSNSSLVVHDPIFKVYGNEGKIEGFCLAIQPTDEDVATIGQNFMSGYRMVFERENLKLRWSRSNCQYLTDNEGLPLSPSNRPPNPLPTTEQQRAPSEHAIAPAVARRTPSKSSAASIQHLSSHLANPFLLLYLHRLSSCL